MNTTTPPPDPTPDPPPGEPPTPPGTGPEPPLTGGPRVSTEQMRDLGRLRRSVADRHVAGVAGGLARHLDIDPIIVRVALVVLVFFGGSGLLLYAAGWLLVPEEGTADQPLGLDERSRRIALIGAGVLAALAALGDWAGAFWFPWPVVGVALVVLWFLNRNQQRHGAVAAPPATGCRTASPYTALGVHGLDVHRLDVRGLHARPRAGLRPRGVRPPAQPAQARADPLLGDARPHRDRRRHPGVIDAAGTDVPEAGYPALAMAVTGVMLVLGAFWGRAGGLILVGLRRRGRHPGRHGVRRLGGHPARLLARPRPAEVRDSYDLGTGELTLDLSGVTDVEDLDGRRITVDGGVGSIEVVVPRGMDVSVDASAGVGNVDVLGPGERRPRRAAGRLRRRRRRGARHDHRGGPGHGPGHRARAVRTRR